MDFLDNTGTFHLSRNNRNEDLNTFKTLGLSIPIRSRLPRNKLFDNEQISTVDYHSARSVRLPTGGYATVIPQPACADAGSLRRQPRQHPDLLEDGADCATRSLRINHTTILGEVDFRES